MSDLGQSFKKSHEFLICIDSDGCAMDTMDCKHVLCFGPSLIPIWELEEWEEEILKRWNEINLYTFTRGINRFKGLAILLTEVNERFKKIEGIEELNSWVESAPELSGKSIKEKWEETGELIYKKAYEWSEVVNASIQEIPSEKKSVFSGVNEALKLVHEFADIAIVSSANHQAVIEEWERENLLHQVDILMSQNMGSKSECLKKLLEQGYDNHHVLMIGDAPGDYQASLDNNILFYPILVRKEVECWKRFVEEFAEKFHDGSYAKSFQNQLVAAFEDNLKIK